MEIKCDSTAQSRVHTRSCGAHCAITRHNHPTWQDCGAQVSEWHVSRVPVTCSAPVAQLCTARALARRVSWSWQLLPRRKWKICAPKRTTHGCDCAFKWTRGAAADSKWNFSSRTNHPAQTTSCSRRTVRKCWSMTSRCRCCKVPPSITLTSWRAIVSRWWAIPMPPRAAVVVSALHSNLDGIIKQLYYRPHFYYNVYSANLPNCHILSVLPTINSELFDHTREGCWRRRRLTYKLQKSYDELQTSSISVCRPTVRILLRPSRYHQWRTSTIVSSMIP